MVPRISDFEAAAEIDFETSEFLFECGTSFAGKDAQLKRLRVIARLRGKMVIGLHRISDPTDLPRLASYKQALDNTTFWDPDIQVILRSLVPNPDQYFDDKPLSAYVLRFEYRA